MQEIRYVSYCDYPGCKEEHQAENPDTGQETSPVTVWFYQNGRGRKTKPIVVDMCEAHIELHRKDFVAMQKYDKGE